MLKTKVLTTQFKLYKGLILTLHRKVNFHFPYNDFYTLLNSIVVVMYFSGQFIEIKYTADENGFQAQGMSLNIVSRF